MAVMKDWALHAVPASHQFRNTQCAALHPPHSPELPLHRGDLAGMAGLTRVSLRHPGRSSRQGSPAPRGKEVGAEPAGLPPLRVALETKRVLFLKR